MKVFFTLTHVKQPMRSWLLHCDQVRTHTARGGLTVSNRDEQVNHRVQSPKFLILWVEKSEFITVKRFYGGKQ
jgi:hypothetical protein